jgi:PEP-CTERM motif
MKKFVLALTFTVLLGNARALADTQTFNAYGAAMLPEQGASMNIAPSVAFPGFTLYTTGLVQLDSPGLDGATNYELLGNQGDLTIAFTVPQNSFSISLRDFKYLLPGGAPAGGLEMITVFGADHTTVLSTYVVELNNSIITSTDSSESAPIGAVNLSKISGEFWTGLLQSVSFSTPDPTPEPASLSLLGIGVLALAGMVRRKLIP